jgi:hypothetical protein
MVMEAATKRPLTTRLSLRSAKDRVLIAEVGSFCARAGVSHKSFLVTALRHAMESDQVRQAALEHEAMVAAQRHKVRSRRMRWYRNRKLL